ncbi:uncharacterized protein LOC120532567 [Polypterus senegalus]|uniref:uncharacterized protein LOC120532567 n=1 Tax=Polypterus senegalus TaxID=55291 RepID=UPI001964CE49|nr:uncharacterized protein LOC120532567 [Polypterus senegalus]XP_039614607.1 uncharacterized protein LOC120532567 [Polypterus senegalus]XP_039614608.1 uncharacterized protein LOC120532567 [Polypterus senegalus]
MNNHNIIRAAKCAHAQRIRSHFQDSGDTWRMWQGIQAIINYRITPPACDGDASLPEALNSFYAWFETQNNVAARKTISPPNNQVLLLTTANMRKPLCKVNPQKTAGPDNISGRVLRECEHHLVDVLTDIFNISLSHATVPTCFKTTIIIPVPKKSSVSYLNDYHPVALTRFIMKWFGKHIKTVLPPSLDAQQFAYHQNHSIDDAIVITLHLAISHLDKKFTYMLMLFRNFTSAFNTLIPQHLIGKLSLLGLNASLCNWIL